MPVQYAFHGAPMWGRAAAGFPLWSVGGIIVGAAFLALAITAIVVLVRWSRRASTKESLEIIRARYARGEIDKEQYEELKRTLSK